MKTRSVAELLDHGGGAEPSTGAKRPHREIASGQSHRVGPRPGGRVEDYDAAVGRGHGSSDPLEDRVQRLSAAAAARRAKSPFSRQDSFIGS